MAAFPLLLLVVIAYNAMVFLGGATDPGDFQEVVFTVPMISGEPWEMTLGGLFGIAGLSFLILEVAKSTDTGSTSQVNQALSLIVFMICLVEFVLLKGFGNDAFFALLLMSFIDVVAGYTIAIRAARRDYGIG